MKSTEEIKAELAELDKKLAEYKGLVSRRADLAQLLALTERLFGQTTPAAQTGAPLLQAQPQPNTNGNRLVTHADFLSKALASGPKNINDLLQEVRALGWSGSDDDATDKKRLYVALYREKNRFSLASGRWRLIQGSA